MMDFLKMVPKVNVPVDGKLNGSKNTSLMNSTSESDRRGTRLSEAYRKTPVIQVRPELV